MMHRFTGPAGIANLGEALLRQSPVQGNAEVAKALAEAATLHQFAPSDVLLAQDGDDNDISFILDGRVSVLVNGRQVSERAGGQHVGEMALIDPVGRRSATVVALTTTLVAKVSAEAFVPIADAHPKVWRLLAVELVERFRQRGASLSAPNVEPQVFIGSSVEGLPVAKAIQAGLAYVPALVETWSTNVFTASSGTMETLTAKAAKADFAIFVATADDTLMVRDSTVPAVRDNVIFELGLFIGALGRMRTVFVMPRDVEMHIPTDLLGITPLKYKSGTIEELPARLGPVCTEIETLIRKHGPK